MKQVQIAKKVCATMLLLLLVLTAAGCETLQFYRQAAWGQWQVMAAREATADLLASEATAPELAERLLLTQEILDFARDTLGLSSEGRYLSYVQLDRKFVVWNVFAAGPYSLADDQWCYPIIGCAPYRGYFSEQRALQVAARYRQRGLETYVGGVPAYSTLGWFDDPLLSSFIHWPVPDLVNLLVHELAHSRVWVNGDVGFNESFAEFVGTRAVYTWFDQRKDLSAWEQWQRRREAWHRFRDFVVQAKAELQTLYSQPQADPAAAKQATLQAFQACYRVHRDGLGGGRYDALMAQHFNNAFLLSVGTYADWLPAFAQLFEEVEGNWAAFFAAVDELAAEDIADRDNKLQLLAQQQIRQATDDQHTHQVNCEAFFGHGFDAKTPA